MGEQTMYKLEMKEITKTYPGVVALNKVSLGFKAGEVHAIVGENGAGKSTLIKCIAGAIRPDSGSMTLDDKTYTHLMPHEARELGIEVIYQEFNLFPELSVMENLFMGVLPGNGIIVDKREMYIRTKKVFEKIGVSISPDTIVGTLTTGFMQMVEIAKAISRNAKILIMDEPTAPLTTSDIEILFKIVGKLRDNGVCVIYISHRLNEIFEISDRCTVMRDGRVVKTINTADTDRDTLIALMVGRAISESFPGHNLKLGEVAIEARNLMAPNVSNVSLSARKGEILGLAGLVGAGRTETVRLLFGADQKKSGVILINGKEVHLKNPGAAMRHGIALCPEDRKTQGVLLPLSISHNISLPVIKRISSGMVVNAKTETKIVNEFKSALSIKAPSANQLVRNLSGGNQQKVVISKWLAMKANIIIFDEPTRGIDVGAKYEIYQLIYRLADEGKAIIVVSSDMEEIMGLSDRIIVLSEGKVAGELTRDEFTQERILDLASGEN